MIHARKDYDRIQDPAVNHPEMLSDGSTPIGPDEPVFLLRAQDKLAPVIVHEWLMAYMQESKEDADMAVVIGVQAHIQLMLMWQKQNGCKVPDTLAGQMKVSSFFGGE